MPQSGPSGASEASPSSEGTPDSQIEDVLQAITAGSQQAAGNAGNDPDAFKAYSQGIQALAQAHALLTGQANVKAAGPPKP